MTGLPVVLCVFMQVVLVVASSTTCEFAHSLPSPHIVAIVGSTLTLNCSYPGQKLNLRLNNHHTADSSDGDEVFHNKGINWTAIPDSENSHSFNIIIIPSMDNDGTIFKCETDSCSTETTLIVAQNPPMTVEGVTANVINDSAIEVSWGLPWSYPVNSYTISIHPLISDNPPLSFDHTDNSINITRNIVNMISSDCHQFNVSIIANTDVISTNASIPITTGFPKSFVNVTSNISISLTKKNCGDSYSYQLIVNPQSVICDYDRVKYMYVITDESGHIVGNHSTYSTSALFAQAVSVSSSYYNISVALMNELNETITSSFMVTDIAEISSDTAITTQPKTTVGLTGEQVTFICASNATNSTKMISYNFFGSESMEELRKKGVTSEEINDGSGYMIMMNASDMIRGIEFSCEFNGCATQWAKLLVADNPPMTVKGVTANVINDSAIDVSWGLPWSYPVNSYTISIHPLISNNPPLSFNHTDNSTNTIITRNIVNMISSDCHQFNVSIIANTDVISTNPSIPITTGFPQFLSMLLLNSTNVTIINGSQIIITLERPPKACQYDVLVYIVYINDTNGDIINQTSPELFDETVHVILGNSQSLEISTLIANITNNKTQDTISIILKTFSVYPSSIVYAVGSSSTVYAVGSSSTAYAVGSSSNTISPTSQTEPSFDVMIVLYVLVGIFGCLLCIAICAIIGIVFICFKRSNKYRSNQTVVPRNGRNGSVGVSIDSFTLPPMNPNPTYDTPPDEAQYDFIPPTMRGLATPPGNKDQLDPAPQLPPRRPSPIPIHCQSEAATTREDDYIQMTPHTGVPSPGLTLSPRYTQTPGSSHQHLPPINVSIEPVIEQTLV